MRVSGILAGPPARWRIPTRWRRLAGCALVAAVGLAFSVPAAPEPPLEGTVRFVRPEPNGGLEIELLSGTNRILAKVPNAGQSTPLLSSRIRITEAQPVAPQRGLVTIEASDPNRIQFLTGMMLPLATNVARLRHLGEVEQHAECVIYLTGQVLAVGASDGAIAFQDDSGAALLEFEAQGKQLIPGQTIVIEGTCTVEGYRARLRSPPLVDNNGMHTMTEESGAIYLSAGKHPLRLAWFNQDAPSGLEVYYQGPGLPRQRIPDSALSRLRSQPADGPLQWTNGLEYRSYEGSWLWLPNFDRLVPAKQGFCTNFDLASASRDINVGLQFSGYIEVPREGIYSFATISDDGSLLFLDETPVWIEITGAASLPAPAPVPAHKNAHAAPPSPWVQAEGTVTFAWEQSGTLELELSSGTGRLHVEVADAQGCSPQILLNSRVRVTGIWLATEAAEAQSSAGILLTTGSSSIELLSVPPEKWAQHPTTPIASLAALEASPPAERVVHLRGRIRRQAGGIFKVEDETGSVTAAFAQREPRCDGDWAEVLGRWSRAGTNLVLRSAFCREATGKPHSGPTDLPLLTAVEKIKRLSREEAQRGYPVAVRGVVTALLDSGFFLQDASGSIYARWWASSDNDGPRVGDCWEVKGTTFAEFAPSIQVSETVSAGTGTLPEPLHPTWDQLMNGSLDTEYVEVAGIVTTAESDEITLLTRAGKLRLLLPEVQPQQLRQYEDALVRVRGCVMPVRNIQTQQVVPGQMCLGNAAISVDEPAPGDPFAIPLKRASDLLLFDFKAGALQRVKVAGQILHQRDGQLFLLDGADGLRVIPKTTIGLRAGDRVEVVGFPDLGGPAPVLREARAHPIGPAPLPAPHRLPADLPLDRRQDATRVAVQARLITVSHGASDQVLELQSGARGFIARLKIEDGALPPLLPGSLLELTGVYVVHASDQSMEGGITSFELLLGSAADVQVLVRPSWWTFGHTLAVLSGMTLFVLAALVWIALLRRQVEERSNQLAAEVRRHEQTERQRELEQERARIAQDLHDDLGATLTQIRFLSALESHDAQLPEATRSQMSQISEKSREMVTSLDEIVWAVNPANDLLPKLANYLCHFAEEFFRPTPIRCRIDADDTLPSALLTSEMRHDLYLVIREAMNNVAKHSQATEAWLRIHYQAPGQLCLAVEDNGRGFQPAAVKGAGNGLANMRRRMEKIGGRFECAPRPGGGSCCRLFLPLPAAHCQEA